MKKNKKAIILIAVAALAAVALYILYRRGVIGGGATPGTTNPDVGGDGETAKRLMSIFSKGYGEDMPIWLLEIADEYMSGARPIAQDYLVQGQLTRTGALMAAWASSYYGYGYSKTSTPEQSVNDEMYIAFNAWKAQKMASNFTQ